MNRCVISPLTMKLSYTINSDSWPLLSSVMYCMLCFFVFFSGQLEADVVMLILAKMNLSLHLLQYKTFNSLWHNCFSNTENTLISDILCYWMSFTTWTGSHLLLMDESIKYICKKIWCVNYAPNLVVTLVSSVFFFLHYRSATFSDVGERGHQHVCVCSC